MASFPLDQVNLRLVQSWDDCQDFLGWLGNQRDFLGADIETTGLNVGRDYIRLCQFGDTTAGWAIDYQDWRGVIKKAFEDYRGKLVWHNSLFDLKFLKKDGVNVRQLQNHDTMIMGHLLNPMARMDLKGLATKYVDPRAKAGQSSLKEAFSLGNWNFATIPVDHPAYWIYSALDTVLTAILADRIYPKIASYQDAYELELACIHVLRDAEINGMLTDPIYRARAVAQLEAELHVLQQQIPCNPNSDAQVRHLLVSHGAQPWPFVTPSGELAVKKEALRWIGVVNPPLQPFCEAVETYRLKDRYLTNYFEKFDMLAVDNVLRPSTRPVGARTGRMSITDPPLQTLPRGRVVRDAFVAREGCSLVLADYAAMEMRVMASDANEEAMIAAFIGGEDLHNFVASNAYGPNFTKAQRQICKNAAFAKIYGAGVEKFAATAKIPVHEAQEFLDRYDGLFPGISRRQYEVIQGVRNTAGDIGLGRKIGYVETYGGRRLPVEVDEAYKAVNYRIQGSCAETTKRKIVELDNAGLGEFFRLPVHDELIFEVPDELVEPVRHIVHEVMPETQTYYVPLTIESDVCKRWGEHYTEDPVYVNMAAA